MSQIELKEIMVNFTISNEDIPAYTNVCLVNQLPDSAMVVNLGYVDPSQVRAAFESNSDSENAVSILIKPSLRFVVGSALAKKLISQLQETLSLIENAESIKPELMEE
jgi:hypothetical protein